MSWQPTTLAMAYRGTIAAAIFTASATITLTARHGKPYCKWQDPRHAMAIPTVYHVNTRGKGHRNLHGSLHT